MYIDLALEITSADDFAKALDEIGKYASGGYPTYFASNSGTILSHEAAQEMRHEIRHAIRTYDASGYSEQWDVDYLLINWEDADLYCDHTGKRIESAYAEDKTEEKVQS